MKVRLRFFFLVAVAFLGVGLPLRAQELKMPEFADWAGQDRLGANIDVEYKSLKK